jgi:RNA polymerase sigma-70 factor (ECF subfamily)
VNTPEEYRDLVINIRKGDACSLELLFRRLYPKLCAYANKFLNNMPDAEDIAQETFLKLYKNKEELDENKSIQSYLFTCVRNGCLNLLEHRKTVGRYERIMALVYLDHDPSITPHESLVVGDIEKEFNSALDRLPSQCRKIFELSRFEGFKYHEIATQLNISVKTVETQMSRALFKIRSELKDHLIMLALVILLTINRYI